MRFLLYLSSLLVLSVAPALAQDMPVCNGTVAIVRVSELKPGGTVKGFMAAAEAHQMWYRNNGVKDNEIVVSRVIVTDPKSGKASYSDKEFITYHMNPPDSKRTPNRGDAAWKAYVKMYTDISDMKSEYVTCMPKHEK